MIIDVENQKPLTQKEREEREEKYQQLQRTQVKNEDIKKEAGKETTK